MRKALLCHDGTEATKRIELNHGGYGKPHISSVPECSTTLLDLTGLDSNRFFTIIGLSDQFLHKAASE